LTTAAAGVVAVAWAGVGAFFGVQAIQQEKQAGSLCPAPPGCEDPRAVSLTGSARRSADISTVSLIASGSLSALAAALYFTRPRSRDAPVMGVAVEGMRASVFLRW